MTTARPSLDRKTLERFVQGDERAVREVYRRYGKSIFSLAYRTLGDRGLAEEAVQQTLLQAWRGAARFDPERAFEPWLYTIARRVTIDLFRREKRHLANDPLDREIAVVPPSFEGAWAAWEIRSALDRMPADERDIVRATHFLGLTHEETAERLGIPVGTVKSRSYRAHRRLAVLLAHLEEATA